MLVNFDEIRDMYDRGQEAAPPLQNFNYVIITTGDLAGAVTSSNFISWKTSTGYSVKIVLVTDPEIAGQPGVDLAEQIRNFLRAYYQVWGIEYVLMVGDYATVHEQFTTNTKTTTSFHNEWPLGSYPPSRWQPMGATDTG